MLQPRAVENVLVQNERKHFFLVPNIIKIISQKDKLYSVVQMRNLNFI